jgi:(R,R)-butanediol dehydrogenase/meso-butanediol dehydrogenase/diacetyl reductase
MRAVRWYGPRDIRIVQVPDPVPGPHDVVIKVAWCGICGTDLDEYLTGPHWVPVETPNPLTGAQAPLTLGHELAGEVAAVGAQVQHLRVGDRVTPDVLIFCGECFWCLRHQVQLCEKLAALGLMADGGLAELCLAPARMCVPVPEAVTLDHAALAEPLSVGVHALRRGRLAPAETVAVVGAGTVGLCALQAALHGGARRVVAIEPEAERRRLALALGASAAIDPRDPHLVDTLHGVLGHGPDLTVDCGGTVESAAAALGVARRGGRVVLVGFPAQPNQVDLAALAAREQELIGSLSHVYDEDFVTAVDLLASGRVQVEPLISSRLPLAEAVSGGFERLAGGDHTAIKVLISPLL